MIEVLVFWCILSLMVLTLSSSHSLYLASCDLALCGTTFSSLIAKV